MNHLNLHLLPPTVDMINSIKSTELLNFLSIGDYITLKYLVENDIWIPWHTFIYHMPKVYWSMIGVCNKTHILIRWVFLQVYVLLIDSLHYARTTVFTSK